MFLGGGGFQGMLPQICLLRGRYSKSVKQDGCFLNAEQTDTKIMAAHSQPLLNVCHQLWPVVIHDLAQKIRMSSRQIGQLITC